MGRSHAEQVKGFVVGVLVVVVGGALLWAFGLNGNRTDRVAVPAPTSTSPSSDVTETQLSTSTTSTEPQPTSTVTTTAVPTTEEVAQTTDDGSSRSLPSTTADGPRWVQLYDADEYINSNSTAFSIRRTELDIAGTVFPEAGRYFDCLACDHEGFLDVNLLGRVSGFRAKFGFTQQSPTNSVASWRLILDGQLIDDGQVAWGETVDLHLETPGARLLRIEYSRVSGGDYPTVVLGGPELHLTAP